jgi:hypothetical protein
VSLDLAPPVSPETGVANRTLRPQLIPNAGRIDYSWDGAVVMVEGATHATFVTGPITMIIIGILLNIVGLGTFCWLLFTLAIYAVPFFVVLLRGSIRFKQAQVHSAPLSLASLRVVSHS